MKYTDIQQEADRISMYMHLIDILDIHTYMSCAYILLVLFAHTSSSFMRSMDLSGSILTQTETGCRSVRARTIQVGTGTGWVHSHACSGYCMYIVLVVVVIQGSFARQAVVTVSLFVAAGIDLLPTSIDHQK